MTQSSVRRGHRPAADSGVSPQALRKAAVLLANLPSEVARVLLAQLPSEVAEQALRRAAALDDVDAAEQQQIVQEFFAERKRLLGGVELDPGLATRLVDAAAIPVPSAESDDPLHQADPELIAAVLRDESPQAVAVVLAQLPPSRAAGLLKQFPPPRQADLLRRLADLEAVSDEATNLILETVRERVADAHSAHVARQQRRRNVAAILAAADSNERSTLLGNLQRFRGDLAAELDPREFAADNRGRHEPAAVAAPPSAEPSAAWSMADIATLEPRHLAVLLRNCPGEDALLAVASGGEELIGRVLDWLPGGDALQLRLHLERLRQASPTRIAAATGRLLKLAAKLSGAGKLPRPARFLQAA